MGKTARGRPGLKYTDLDMKDIGCHTYIELKMIADDRIPWRGAAKIIQGFITKGEEHYP